MSDDKQQYQGFSNQDEAIVQAYYQGIEDLANQVLSYLRNVDLVQAWELRDLMYSNLRSQQERPGKIDFTN